MNYYKEVSAVILITLFTLLAPTTLAYEENIREGIFLVRPDNEFIPETTTPTYLQEEDLTFFACTEQDSSAVRLSVICQDTNEFIDLETQRWGPDSCYIGSTNLEQLDCTSAVARAEYTEAGENRQLEQRIQINKFSNALDKIVETQFSDGGWENPLDTAHGLYVLNHFPDLFEQRIDDAIEYLKINREEANKCWPKEQCQISTTANILFLLEEAGFEDLRIQHDAKLYLEREQTYITSDTTWKIEITDHTINLNNTLNTSCVFEYQGATETFSIPKHPEPTYKNFTPEHQARIGVACTEPVFIELQNEFGETRIPFQGDNFTHTIPPPCWTRNNEHINCDVRTTLFAVNTDINNAQKNAARNYLQNLLVDDRTAGKHVTEDWTVINNALYAHGGLTNSNDILTALLYHQTNSGAWMRNNTYYQDTFYEPQRAEREARPERLRDEVTRTIINTGYAILSLLSNDYERDAEPIRDAERYVSLAEDQTSQNATDEQLTDEEFATAYHANTTSILEDPKRNALAFVVLQNNARPLLRTQPRILNANQQEVTIDIINPTIFELEELSYELNENLQGVIDVEEKDYVGPYSFRRVTISLLENEAETFGYLRLTKGDNEYLKLPIIVSSKPELEITLPEQLTIFGASTNLPFEVHKSNHEFSCGIEWNTSGISSSSTFNINNVNNTYNYPVRFSAVRTENRVYEGIIECSAAGVTFRNPFATEIVRFSTNPIEVSPAAVSINASGQEKNVFVTNQLDETIEVEMRLREADPYILIDDPLSVLAPGETRELPFQVIPPEGENYTTTNTFIISTFDVEERVLLDVDIRVQPPGPTSYLPWIALGILLLALTAASIIGYRRKDELSEWYEKHFHKEDIKKRVQEEVAKLEAEEQKSAIRNMIRIYKLQGLKDSKVREQLLEEGYTEQEIDAAISSAPTDDAQEKPPTQ